MRHSIYLKIAFLVVPVLCIGMPVFRALPGLGGTVPRPAGLPVIGPAFRWVPPYERSPLGSACNSPPGIFMVSCDSRIMVVCETQHLGNGDQRQSDSPRS